MGGGYTCSKCSGPKGWSSKLCVRCAPPSRGALKHGHATHANRTPEYGAWRNMITRCEVPTDRYFLHYGGRGIAVCPRWRKSFVDFLADIGERPSPKHSLDRINNDGNYEPGNVRWATAREQARNSTQCHWIEFNGERMILADWAARIGITRSALRSRLRKLPLEQALTLPPVRGPRGFAVFVSRESRLRGWETRRAKQHGTPQDHRST